MQKNCKISLLCIEWFCSTCYQLWLMGTGLLAIGQNITITLSICLFSFIRQGWYRNKCELIRVKPLQTLYYPCNFSVSIRRVSTIHSIIFYVLLKKWNHIFTSPIAQKSWKMVVNNVKTRSRRAKFTIIGFHFLICRLFVKLCQIAKLLQNIRAVSKRDISWKMSTWSN